MLFSILKDALKRVRASAATPRTPKSVPVAVQAAVAPMFPQWHVYGDAETLQKAFDVAVIMPTVGRPSLRDAVQSVYEQAFNGRIQLLIGVDAPLGSFKEHEKLFEAAPSNVTVCLFYAGYSTSVRHGGLHPARDGGVLRAVLTYMANARHVAYLDDDNWWSPVHLQSLFGAIQGKDWAHSDRWFVDQDTRQVLCADEWESIGPGRGFFKDMFGGWVDPNCLMFDKLTCEPAIRLWTVPLPGDTKAMSADRHVFGYMNQKSAPAATRLITTYYALQADDGMHPYRLRMMEGREERSSADKRSSSAPADFEFSFLLPTRNRTKGLAALLESVKAMTARPAELEIILGIDEDDHASREFVWDGLNIVKVIVPPGLTMGRLNQACYARSRGRYLMAMNDDILLRTPKWDDHIRSALDAVQDEIFLIHVNDLLFRQNLCCFPMVSRTFCDMAGGFCPDEYERYRIDDHIHEVFSMLGARGHQRIFYLPGVVFEHLNYFAGKDGQRVYPLNREVFDRDVERFETSRPARLAFAERLARYIDGAREQRLSAAEKRLAVPVRA